MAISSLLSDNVTALQATGGIRSLSYLSINPWQKSPESGTTGETACPTEQHGRNQRRRLKGGGGQAISPMSYSFPITGHLYKLWGGPPGPRPTPSSACSGLDETDLLGKERVQGGPARTRGSAPQFMQDSQFRENYMTLGYQPAPRPEKYSDCNTTEDAYKAGGTGVYAYRFTGLP